MSTYVSESLKSQLDAVDARRCAYCLTSEVNSGIPMTYDHILPRSKGGATTFENLCLACPTCNEFKSDNTKAEDPLTCERISLFNPRTQIWTEHFT